jgi:hypothetical protein
VENDFEFIVGDFYFPNSHITADFLLPKIARLWDVDVTMSSYCICRIQGQEILKPNVSSGNKFEVSSSLSFILHNTSSILKEKCIMELSGSMILIGSGSAERNWDDTNKTGHCDGSDSVVKSWTQSLFSSLSLEFHNLELYWSLRSISWAILFSNSVLSAQISKRELGKRNR